MNESYSSHKEFKQQWATWRNGKLKKDKKAKGNVEPESVTKARNEFHRKNDELYVLKIYPLEKQFRENQHLAFAELVEFLSVDIAAFRCGYAKEVFLQWLKQTSLTASEIIEIQRVALKMCETENVRREFRRWCRLMIKLADVEFVLKLKEISSNKSRFPQLKSKWMLEIIQQQRLDLRKIIKNK